MLEIIVLLKCLLAKAGNIKFNYRVGLIIECGDEILVEVNPSIDFVTLPGGRAKTMESSKEGIRREINEELHYLLTFYRKKTIP